MTKITFIAFTFILLFSSCHKQEYQPLELANEIKNTYEQKTSLSYDIDYQIKFFSEPEDTNKVSAQIDLIRAPQDSIFGGYVWIDMDSIERYYDLKNTYLIFHKEKKVTRYKKSESWAITGGIVGEAIRMYFLKPNRLTKGAKDSTIVTNISKENIDGKALLKWNYEFPKDEYTDESWKNMWINPDDFSIPKMNFYALSQGENQYNQWDLSNIVFDKVSAEDLKQRFDKATEGYLMEDYKERSREEMEPLANGTPVPNLSGEFYSNGKKVSLSDYKGKPMLIDFWYMDCFPCIKAIPHLVELNEKYADQGLVVLGIDPLDNTEKNRKRLPNFIERNNLSYPIVFTDRADNKDFKIFAYPTLYIIDKKGKVAYANVGFGEDMVSQMDSVIQTIL